MSRGVSLGRFVIAWGTVALFLVFGGAWLADLTSPLKAAVLFIWLLGVIVWCAFGVVEQAVVLNGVVGLALLLGGLRHHQQEYNLQGAAAYVAVIVPLSVVPLVLPNFTRSTPDSTLTGPQAFFFAVFTVLLYAAFLGVQTVRHRHFFVEPSVVAAPDAVAPAISAGGDQRAAGGAREPAVTLALSMLTFSGSPTTTVLEGAVHLVVFMVYVVLIFSP